MDKISRLTLSIINNNDTSKAQTARRDMEGFYACQLNRNEERFLIAAFGVTNASTSDPGPSTVCKSTTLHKNKKVLLRDRKRHTARHVASTRSAVLSLGRGGGTPVPAGVAPVPAGRYPYPLRGAP